MKASCPWCVRPNVPPHHDGSPVKIAFLATDLCDEHLEMSGIPEYERRHPLVGNERPCNTTCGCLSGDEADRFLADPESFGR